MARVRVSNILKIEDKDEQLREAMSFAKQLEMEGTPLALAYNLTGDLFMKQSLREVPVEAKLSISDASIYYKKAVKLAPECVETAAAYGACLIALGKYNLAEVVLQQGLSIADSHRMHPFLNHIEITDKLGTKEQLVARAKARIGEDLLYIKTCREDQNFTRVVKWLGNPQVKLNTILSAASDVAKELPSSARAKLLYPHAVLEALRSGRILSNRSSEQEEEQFLQSAVNQIQELSAGMPQSLNVCLLFAKLNVALGFFDAAEIEYCRALRISTPDDPRFLDIPLGSTRGLTFADRVLLAQEETIGGLMALTILIHTHFDSLSEEDKARLLTVRVDELLMWNLNDVEITATVSEAIEYFKMKSSWLSWRCPSEDNLCRHFVASNSSEFLSHLCEHADVTDFFHKNSIFDNLLPFEDMPVKGLQCSLYMTQDNEENDIFCITKLGHLFEGISAVLTRRVLETSAEAFDNLVHKFSTIEEDGNGITKMKAMLGVFSGSRMDSISPGAAFADFVDGLSTLNIEDAGAFDHLSNLWENLLKSCATDKREQLMPLVVMFHWAKLKKMMETQISEISQLADSDKLLQSEEAVHMHISRKKGLPKRKAASRACRHALTDGHGSLHRRISVINALTAQPVKVTIEENDPYSNEIIHLEFANLPPHRYDKDLIPCSGCYFEKGVLRFFKQQFLVHFYRDHYTCVVCPICFVRFTTASALAYHIQFVHNAHPDNNQQVIEIPD